MKSRTFRKYSREYFPDQVYRVSRVVPPRTRYLHRRSSRPLNRRGFDFTDRTSSRNAFRRSSFAVLFLRSLPKRGEGGTRARKLPSATLLPREFQTPRRVAKVRESCRLRTKEGKRKRRKKEQGESRIFRWYSLSFLPRRWKAQAVSVASLGWAFSSGGRNCDSREARVSAATKEATRNRGATQPSGFPEGVACSMVSSVRRACATGSSSLSIPPWLGKR